MPISPVDLYRKCVEKALFTIHTLAVLNIHFGGNKYISQSTLSEYLKSLTYQALNQENDKTFMSFDDVELLINDLLEQFVRKENAEVEKASAVSKEVKNQLKTNLQLNLFPEMKIQKGEEEEETETELKPIEFSTPLKKEEIEEIYNEQKENFLKTALKINQTDLETATDMADADSEALIDEIINPTPCFVVDDKLNVDTQLDFQNSDLDTSFILSNTLQERLDDILEKARTRVSSLKFPGEAKVDIPNDIINDSLYPHSQIKTEDIYIDDSLKDMLYPDKPMYFPQPSADDRTDFELNVSGDDLIVFKPPTLNFVSIAKKDLKDSLDKIIEDLEI